MSWKQNFHGNGESTFKVFTPMFENALWNDTEAMLQNSLSVCRKKSLGVSRVVERTRSSWTRLFCWTPSLLITKQPQATSLARMTTFYESTIRCSFFVDKLDSVLKRKSFQPLDIYFIRHRPVHVLNFKKASSKRLLLLFFEELFGRNN